MMPQGCAAAAPEGQDQMQAADDTARLSRQTSRRPGPESQGRGGARGEVDSSTDHLTREAWLAD